jgi:site-specific recombinase XerD
MQPGVDQMKHGKGSEEREKEIHTTLDFFRLDMRVWQDDISNSTSSLPDAFEGLAGRNIELDQTLRKTLRGMLQHLASVEEMVDSEAGPSMSVARSFYHYAEWN